MILEKKILPEIVSKHGNWAKRQIVQITPLKILVTEDKESQKQITNLLTQKKLMQYPGTIFNTKHSNRLILLLGKGKRSVFISTKQLYGAESPSFSRISQTWWFMSVFKRLCHWFLT
jgi:hypothetical protein